MNGELILSKKQSDLIIIITQMQENHLTVGGISELAALSCRQIFRIMKNRRGKRNNPQTSGQSIKQKISKEVEEKNN